MSGLVRMSVSVESELLDQIDRLCDEHRFASRSDAFRQVFRGALADCAWHTGSCQALAILTLVCDGACHSLNHRLTELQHAQLDLVVATMRVYVDRATSLEVIILRGGGKRLDNLASRLCSLKGVQSGKLVVATAKKNPRIGTTGDRDGNSRPTSM